MPSSSVLSFSDPDEYSAAIRATTIDLTVIGRGHFTGKRTRIDFHHLWMQRLFESLPRTLHSAFVPGRAIVTFPIAPGENLIWGGAATQSHNVIRHVDAEEAFQHSSGPTSWGAMSLPVPDMVAAGEAMAGVDLTPPNHPLVLTPSPLAVARLQSLHHTAGVLAEDVPAILAHPEAARGLEQALIEAMLECLGGGQGEEDRTAVRQHAAIMRRFYRVIEQHLDQPLFMPELSMAVGASERTLNACCHEHLGMAPKQFLLLRRMHMIRRALREGTPAETTVTEIATRYGFWQFGRLAGEYKALFGESPSATLARSP